MKELLAQRKAHGQGVEPGCQESVATAPVFVDGFFEIDEEAADNQFGHGVSIQGRVHWYKVVPIP
jgi:hypothetical protein